MYVCVINIKRAVEVSFSLTMTLATYQLLFLFPFVFSDVGPLNKMVRDIFNEKIDCSVTYRSMQMPRFFFWSFAIYFASGRLKIHTLRHCAGLEC